MAGIVDARLAGAVRLRKCWRRISSRAASVRRSLQNFVLRTLPVAICEGGGSPCS